MGEMTGICRGRFGGERKEHFQLPVGASVRENFIKVIAFKDALEG